MVSKIDWLARVSNTVFDPIRLVRMVKEIVWLSQFVRIAKFIVRLVKELLRQTIARESPTAIRVGRPMVRK